MSEQRNDSTAVVTIENMDKNKYNILVPTVTMQQVSPWHVARISQVQASSDPDSGDVFKVGSKMIPGPNDSKKFVDLLAPAKPLLMKIAAAAGIVWDPTRTGPISISRDYVMYQAVGAIRQADGSWRVLTGRKEIDLEVIGEELMEQNLKKGKAMEKDPKDKKKLDGQTVEDWAKAQTKSALIQWRKHKLSRAETGAMERVIRAVLGMKHQYTAEELSKPFVVPRIDFSPDYNDPEVRKAMIDHGVKSMATLFGSSAPAQISPTVDPFRQSHIEHVMDIPDDQEDFSMGFNEGGYTDEDGAEPGPENEQPPTHEEPPEAGQQDDGKARNQCKKCKAFISKRVKEFSIEKFGEPLCMNCQPK